MAKGSHRVESPHKRFKNASNGRIPAAGEQAKEKTRASVGERATKARRGLGRLAVNGAIATTVVGGVGYAVDTVANYVTMPAVYKDQIGATAEHYTIFVSAASLIVAGAGAFFARRRWRNKHPKTAERADQQEAVSAEVDDALAEAKTDAELAIAAEALVAETEQSAQGNEAGAWAPEAGNAPEVQQPQAPYDLQSFTIPS